MPSTIKVGLIKKKTNSGEQHVTSIMNLAGIDDNVYFYVI